jgi:hypothetical protein
MADEVSASDSGSVARVAFDLAAQILYWETEKTLMNRTAYLDLYAECLLAAKGKRKAGHD